jgi:hypothetical protein
VTAGFCQACWNIQHANIIACHHQWHAFIHTSLAGTPCDFGLPAHTVVSHTLAYSCHICHAMCCSGCIG